MVNGEFVEDADDDILLDLQLCLPTFSFKHRDSRPRRLDKIDGRWFQAEENSADPTADVRPVQGAGAGDLAAINEPLNLLNVTRPTRRKVSQLREEARVQKQAARSRPTRRFQFPLGSSHGRYNFSSSGGCSLQPCIRVLPGDLCVVFLVKLAGFNVGNPKAATLHCRGTSAGWRLTPGW